MHSIYKSIEKTWPQIIQPSPKCDSNEINDHLDKEMGMPLNVCFMHKEKDRQECRLTQE